MSIKVSSWVWDNVPVKATNLLVMLALADACNDEGECYPGHQRLADKARVSKDHVGKILNGLRDDNWIRILIHEGISTDHGNTNRYQIIGYRESIGLESPKRDGGLHTTPHEGLYTTPKPSGEPSVKEKDFPDPKNGSGVSTSKSSKQAPTTVVHFQDVSVHWDKETQTWDDDRYIWIGRQNDSYRMPLSKWHNPFIPRDDRETPECRKLYGEFIRLDRKTIELYNQAREELPGKILVDSCIPIEDSHGHELAEIANKKGFRKRTEWYEAVRIVFKHHGPSNTEVQKMLQGIATKGLWAECNLDPPLQSVMEIYEFEQWYHQEYPDRSGIVQKANSILSEINNWRAWRLKRLEAPQPAAAPPPAEIPLNSPVAAMSFPGMSISFEAPEPVDPLPPEEREKVNAMIAEQQELRRQRKAQEAAEGKTQPLTPADILRQEQGGKNQS